MKNFKSQAKVTNPKAFRRTRHSPCRNSGASVQPRSHAWRHKRMQASYAIKVCQAYWPLQWLRSDTSKEMRKKKMLFRFQKVKLHRVYTQQSNRIGNERAPSVIIRRMVYLIRLQNRDLRLFLSGHCFVYSDEHNFKSM